jgi:fimbrial chaperone protein
MYAPSRWLLGVAGLFMALQASTGLAANSVLIWPIDPVLEADQHASALWLENRGSETVNMQVRVFAWSQRGFDDQYRAQREIVASPPVAKIEPGHKQLIRLTRVAESPAGQELAYRVIIDEIPSAPVERQGEGQAGTAIRFQMRYSVPLFVYGAGLWSKEDATRSRDPKGIGQADLRWSKVTEAGRTYAVIRNQGAVHARLTDVTFQLGSQNTSLAPGLLGYVLAGAVMRWPLPDAASAGQTLQARVNGATRLQVIARQP